MDDVLTQALENELLSFYLQPIVSLSTNLCTGFELLSRCPELGFTNSSPSAHLYKSGNDDAQLKHFQLSIQRAIATQRALSSIGFQTLAVFVNVAITDFSVENCRWVSSMSRHRLKGICLEISEQVDTYLTTSMIQRIHRLRHDGAAIAIDDYGMGYSNDLRTASIPFDYIKLDKRFLSTPRKDPEYIELKHKIANWRAQGKGVVMEGIENIGHLKAAKALNTSHAQGYHYSEALPFLDAVQWTRDLKTEQAKSIEAQQSRA